MKQTTKKRAPRLPRLVARALELGARRRGFKKLRNGVEILRLPVTDDELASGCPTLLGALAALRPDHPQPP